MVDKLKKIWMNGKLVDWDDAKVHVLSHAILKACRQYSNKPQTYLLVKPADQAGRPCSSAQFRRQYYNTSRVQHITKL